MPEGLDQIKEFFRCLHGDEPTGYLIVWTRQDKATRAFDLSSADALDQAAKCCAQQAERFDVYAAVGLQREPPQRGSRGAEDGVVSIPGVWADIDIGGPAHKAKNLPASETDAFTLIQAVGLRPSIVVRSGFGLQVYWRFKEPWLLESDAERAAAKSLCVRFQALLRRIAKSRGWTVDSTADLCRVFRIPGTFNRKIPQDIRAVTAKYTDSAYNPSDLDEIGEASKTPSQSRVGRLRRANGRRPSSHPFSRVAPGCATAAMTRPACRNRSGTGCSQLLRAARMPKNGHMS